VVTSARLRLVTPPRHRATALVGFESVSAALGGAATLVRLGPILALELVLGDGLAVVSEHLGTRPPLDPLPAAALLVEVGAHADPAPELAEAVGGVDGVVGAAVAVDERDRLRLWRWREAHPEAAAAAGAVHKADVTLPAAAMAAFLDQVVPQVQRILPEATVLRYGHLGDGNIHVNVVRPPGVAPSVGDEAVDAVLGLVVDHGGSVSAEHGIGVAKRTWLERQRGTEVVRAMRAVKAALDPDRILNPAVLV
jgi:FAD/FMN-containing dehydrogenase